MAISIFKIKLLKKKLISKLLHVEPVVVYHQFKSTALVYHRY